MLRSRDGDKPPMFVPSHRRLPHVGAKVAFLSDELLRHVAGATADGPHAVELGFLALGEFVYAARMPASATTNGSRSAIPRSCRALTSCTW